MKKLLIQYGTIGVVGVCLVLLVSSRSLRSQQKPTPAETPAAAEASTTAAQTPSQETPPAQPPQTKQQSHGHRGWGEQKDGEGFMRPEPVAVAPGDDTPVPMEAINLNNVEMRQVIQKIADWTQKPVIPVNDEMMQTKLTIYSPKTVTRSEALSLIVLALQSRGIVVEQLENRIMLRPLASVRLGSVPTIGSEEPLARIEDKSQIVEKWFRLNNYSPTRLVQIIAPLTASYGYAVADEGTSRVAVIDTVDNLMRIERLIQQLDVPESEQEIERVFELKYADPMEVVQVLQLILGQGRSSGRGGSRGGTSTPAPAPSGGGQPAGQPGGELKTAMSVVIDSGSPTPIRLIPLAKQRWILARGSRDDIRRIEEWMQKLDVEAMEEMRQTVVPVRYADVREVVKMVQNTLQQMPGTELRANIVVEALTQTGQIVIYGSEANRTMVERLIAQIDLPKEDFFEERTFRLKHADPDQIKKNIENLYTDAAAQQSMGRFYSYSMRQATRPEDTVKVISYPMLKQVTVIASPTNLDKITRQIEDEWDKPIDIERDQYRIISLKNSDPVRMADLLSQLFTQESASGGSQNFFRMLFGGADDSASRQKIVGSLYGMLTFEPVPDTKKIIVISQIPEAYDIIDRLVANLDGREDAEIPRVIILKYADPEALCDQLNAILNEAGTPVTLPRSVRGLSAYDASKTNQAVSTSEDSSANITPWWTRQRIDSTKLPTSNLIGRVRFVPVHRSKAVLVLSPPEYLDDITQVIETLDQPGMQVMIKAVIVEIGLSDMTSLGVKVASNPAAFGPLGVNAMTALNQLSVAETRGSFSFAADADISVLVDLLVKHANGKVLNQPTLWTKDNEEAIFVKGQKVAFITGDQTANTGSTQRTFTFEDVGVTLRIRPNITPEKAVDLTINLNISKIEPELINDQNVRSNLDSTTRMIVNDGQSVMMGGILNQTQSKIQHKVPLLGDLPLLGGLFRHEATQQSNSELLVFVTPYVVDEQTLETIPADPTDRTQTLEQSRQTLDATIESLNTLFMTPEPALLKE